MNRAQIQKWEKTKEKGMLRFVLLRGVLGWGVPVFIIMAFVVNKVSFGDERFVKGAIAFLIFGALLGCYLWVDSEKKYKKVIDLNSGGILDE